MKFYDAEYAPSPRRARMFLAEKGITNIEYIKLDLPAGDNLSEDFAAKNPVCKVPVLELDNGTCISEVAAIFRYIEEMYPDNPLLGRTAEEKAVIEMWDRRLEAAFLYPAFNSFQHSTGIFKDRMTPVAEWGVEARNITAKFYPILEAQLSKHTYVAGDNFSAADITAVVTVDFAKVIKLRADEYPNIQRWHALMMQRPGYAA
ncbi:glutathione S-transferase family protein [Bacterioplanoides sp.]|uniref:glutathione S-transferase family protein n=1 Tax=Bacterioplanoides sp. TaxID=2066072 RepID=UPI003B00D9BC